MRNWRDLSRIMCIKQNLNVDRMLCLILNYRREGRVASGAMQNLTKTLLPPGLGSALRGTWGAAFSLCQKRIKERVIIFPLLSDLGHAHWINCFSWAAYISHYLAGFSCRCGNLIYESDRGRPPSFALQVTYWLMLGFQLPGLIIGSDIYRYMWGNQQHLQVFKIRSVGVKVLG